MHASTGIYLGKTTFNWLHRENAASSRKKCLRRQRLAYTANLPSSLIGLKPGAGAHSMCCTARTRS